MVKRVAATVLWFFTIASAWNFVVLMSDLPSFLGIALGAAAAAFVWADPLHLIWPVVRTEPAPTAERSTVSGALQGPI
jgi:hypothetical protein